MDYDINYQRVKIGRSYTGKMDVYWYVATKPLPPVLQASSSELTGTMQGYVNSPEILHNRWHKYRTLQLGKYELSFIYKPKGIPEDDVQTLKVLTPSGNVAATVTIKAHKTFGFFPPAKWFPGLRHDDQALESQ